MTPQKTKFKPACLHSAGKQTETCLRTTCRQVGLIPEEWERKIVEYEQIGIYNRSFVCQFKSIQ
jgi:hypothetical protein